LLDAFQVNFKNILQRGIDKNNILCYLSHYTAMVVPTNEKHIRKPRNVKINPDTLLKARVEALRSKGEWLEEAIEEKIERTKEG